MLPSTQLRSLQTYEFSLDTTIALRPLSHRATNLCRTGTTGAPLAVFPIIDTGAVPVVWDENDFSLFFLFLTSFFPDLVVPDPYPSVPLKANKLSDTCSPSRKPRTKQQLKLALRF